MARRSRRHCHYCSWQSAGLCCNRSSCAVRTDICRTTGTLSDTDRTSADPPDRCCRCCVSGPYPLKMKIEKSMKIVVYDIVTTITILLLLLIGFFQVYTYMFYRNSYFIMYYYSAITHFLYYRCYIIIRLSQTANTTILTDTWSD